MSMTAKIMDDYRSDIKDPRPDLADDSAKWQDLLILARMKYHKQDPDFCWNLYGFRCMGTRIVDNGKGGYKLEPLIDDHKGFFPGEYEEMRDKYFPLEKRRQIRELLVMLKNKEALAG